MSNKTRGKWTEGEENLLIRIAEGEKRSGHPLDWSRITLLLAQQDQRELPSRVQSAVEMRWKKLVKEGYASAEIIPKEESKDNLPSPSFMSAPQVLTSVSPSPPSHPSVLPPYSLSHSRPSPPIPTPASAATQGFALGPGVVLLDLGQFTSSSEDYPVGYRLVRILPSTVALGLTQYLFSIVLDSSPTSSNSTSPPGIVFQIVAADQPGLVYRDKIALEVWMQIQIKIFLLHGAKFWMGKETAGMEIFGLLNSRVLHMLASLPRVSIALPPILSPVAQFPLPPRSAPSWAPFPSIPSPPKAKLEYESSPYSPLADSLGIDLVSSPNGIIPATRPLSPLVYDERGASVDSNTGTPFSEMVQWGSGEEIDSKTLLPSALIPSSSPASSFLPFSSPPTNLESLLDPEVAPRIQPKRKAIQELTKMSYEQGSSDIEDFK